MAGVDRLEVTIGLLTQNVRGFGASEADKASWLASFERQQDHGNFDVVYVQETHVEEHTEHLIAGMNAGIWGFRTGPGCPQLSHWSPGTGSAAVVGILFHPQSRLVDPVPFLRHAWTPHFIALKATLEGEPVYLLNVYAPNDQRAQAAFFRDLAEMSMPEDGHIYLRGDFNCTLHATQDRPFSRTAQAHGSKPLENLLKKWKLSDSLAEMLPEAADHRGLDRFRAQQHSHSYSIPGVGLATSRLDRWYLNDTGRKWAACTIADGYGAQSDHRGVLLHLRSPRNPVRVVKEPRAFPLPEYARERGHTAVLEELEGVKTRLVDNSITAGEAADLWDTAKQRIVKRLLQTKRDAKKSKRNTYRNKLKRMYTRLDTAVARATSAADSGEMEGVAPATAVTELLQWITEVKRVWVRAKTQRLFRSHAWREDHTTKQFFRRISCKFEDNMVPALQPDGGDTAKTPNAKAQVLASAWKRVMQGPATRSDKVREVVGWMDAGDSAETAQFASGDFITEDTVAAALAACKAGKACGPDRLNNDWYRTFAQQLAPLLTILYRLWYSEKTFPNTFMEADIFSLKKSGDSSNPMNYRPLALLNTDYTVLTRLITTELRKTIAQRISVFQNGFVPGRQIHATLDYFHAAQLMAQSAEHCRRGLVLLLDFAKAYDSLDRGFLYEALRRHGYPEHFVQVIASLHENTSVRFLANGARSERVQVTRGIRQGCPLAPILFIQALAPLYQRLASGEVHHGIPLRTQQHQIDLRVGGYADDTSTYLEGPEEVAPVVDAVDEFGEASGLLLNKSKTVAIPLHPDGLPLDTLWTADICLVASGEHCRYLGIQAGSIQDAEAAWEFAKVQIQRHHRLASKKTLTIAQRTLVAKAIIVPKLLFVGRHTWPSKATIHTLSTHIKNYI